MFSGHATPNVCGVLYNENALNVVAISEFIGL